MAGNFFTAGGTVQAGSGLYVRRQADDDLLQCCLRGEYAYVLAPRQVGKSSLMVSVSHDLERQGVRCARVDLTEVGHVDVTASDCYRLILKLIARRIGLEIDVDEWWERNTEDSNSRRFIAFFETVLLKAVAGSIVVFLDEIDVTFDWDFSDDFFAAIRFLYNARAQNANYKRVSFVLLGVATPSDLVKDNRHTPFNIGTSIDMSDFSPEQTLPLTAGLGLSAMETESVTQSVLAWTGGHPYLTQRLLDVLAGEQRDHWTVEEIDQIVRRVFLDDQKYLDHNLAEVGRALSAPGPYTYRMLTTYRNVLGRLPVLDDARSPVKTHLRLTGVVRRSNAVLRVRNKIYATLFGPEWVREQRSIQQEQAAQKATAAAFALLVFSVILAGYTWYEHLQSEKSRVQASREAILRSQAEKAANEANRARTLADLSEKNTKLLNQKLTASVAVEEALREAAQQSEEAALKSASTARLATELSRRANDAEADIAQKEKLSREKAEQALREKDKSLTENKILASQLSGAVLSGSARSIAASETDSTDLGVLLSVEGYRRQPTNDALNTVAATLSHLPRRFSIPKDKDVSTLALNHDGSEIALGDRTGRIRTYSVRSGQLQDTQRLPSLIKVLAFHDRSIAGVDQKGNPTGRLPPSNSDKKPNVHAINADGTAYVTVEGDDKTVDYWSAGNLNPHQLSHHEQFRYATFSGQRLFVLCDGALYAYKLPGFEKTRIDVPKEAKDALAGAKVFSIYSPSDATLAAFSFLSSSITSIRLLVMTRGAISVYAVRSSSRGIWPLQHLVYKVARLADIPQDSPGNDLLISPKGGEVTIAGDLAVRRYDIATGRETLRIYLPRGLTAMAVSSDDQYIATAEPDGTITTWMTAGGPVLSHSGLIPPAGIGENPLLRAFALLPFMLTNPAPGHLEFSDDKTILRTNGGPLQRWQWETDRWTLDPSFDSSKTAKYWISDDGSHAVRTLYDSPSFSSGSLFFIRNFAKFTPTAFQEKTETAWVDLRSNNSLRASAMPLIVPGAMQSAGISSNGVWAVIATDTISSSKFGGAIPTTDRSLYRFRSGMMVSPSVTVNNRATGLAISPDGATMLVASPGEVLELNERGEVKLSIKLAGPESIPNTSLCFSRDGKRFAIANGNQIRIFATNDPQQVKTIPKVSAMSPTFSPDGSYLAAIAQGTVLIWNIDHLGNADAQGNVDHTEAPINFIAPPSLVTALSFSPSGRYLATGGSDGIRIWLWRPEDVIAEACSRVRRPDGRLTPDEWKNYISNKTSEAYREEPTCKP